MLHSVVVIIVVAVLHEHCGRGPAQQKEGRHHWLKFFLLLCLAKQKNKQKHNIFNIFKYLPNIRTVWHQVQ